MAKKKSKKSAKKTVKKGKTKTHKKKKAKKVSQKQKAVQNQTVIVNIKNNPGLSTIIILAVLALAYLLIFKTQIFGLSETIATVNGEKITEKQLDDLYNTIPVQFRPFITREQLLNQTINEVLLLQEAKKSGISVTESDAEDYIEIQLQGAGLYIDQFKQSLEMQNMTYKRIKELYKKQLIINNFLNSTIDLSFTVEEKEITDYYLNNKEQFKQDEQVRAAHILVDTEEEAQEILNKIKSGEDFGELAKEHSKDSSGILGGDLGFFGKGVMVKEFEEASFKLSVGEVSSIVETQFGYHIIKLTEKKEVEIQSLSEVRDQILIFLEQEKQKAVVQEYIDQLKSKSEIKIFE